MKKQVLSLAMTASMLATLAPLNVLAADESTVTFEENLYYNDFSENMDGLTVLKNSKSDAVSVVDGKLKFDLKDIYSDVCYTIDGSEDWEEYTVLARTDIQGDPTFIGSRMMFYPKSDDISEDYCYGWLWNTREEDGKRVKHNVMSPVGNEITAWNGIMGQGMYTKVSVNKNSTWYYSYPITQNPTEETLNTMYDALTDKKSLHTKTNTIEHGKFAFGALYDTQQVYVDELQVKDLRAKAAVTSATTGLSAGDTVTIKFSEAMNTETLTADNFYLTDGTTQIDVKTVDVTGDKTVAVTIPDDAEEGVTYTLVAKKEIKDADGDRLNNDKKFEIKMAGNAVTFEENLYYNDFSENMNGLTQIKNDKNDNVSVVDGKLQFDLKDKYSVVRYEIDGSDGWEEYNVLVKTKMETDAETPYTRIVFYPRYKADGDTADETGYMWFVNNNSGRVESPEGNGINWKSIIGEGMYTKINVNKAESHYYSYPLTQSPTEALLDENYEKVKTDARYTKTHKNSDGKFVIEAKWAAKKAWVDEIKVVDLRAKAAVASDVSALEAGDKITVKFSEAMDTAKFTMDNVYFKTGEGTVAPAAVSPQGNKKMIITVPEDLLSGEDYTLVIKKEVTDADGDRMNTDKSFAVKTAKAKFNILSTSPAHGEENVNVLSDVTISFDGTIDYEMESAINLKITDGEGKSVAHCISHAQSTATRMYVMFSELLEPATEYHVEISGVKSTEGYKISGTKKFSFTTKEAGADYLYTNDFSDPATISDFEIARLKGDETVTVEDGVLKIDTTNLNGNNNTQYNVSAKLLNSDSWSDYEVEMDIKGVSNFQFPYVSVRGGTVTETLASVSDDLKSSLTGFDTVSLGKTAFTAFHSEAKKLVIRAEGNNFTVTYDGNVIHQGEGGSTAAAKGAITLGNKWYGSIAIDNLKVKDLGISAYVKNPKNVCEGDEIFVVFDKEMNQDTLTAEHVSVAAASDGAEVKISTRVVDSKTLAIKLPYGIASNELYTITLTQDITSENGLALATEKKLEIKAAEKDFSVGGLKLISGNTEVEALQKNTAIKAQAHFKNSTVSETPEKAVLVMAVYNADGGCVAVKTKPVSLDKKTDGTFETESYTLPENIEGYSVKIICVDSLENIKPMIVSREY